MEVTVVLLCREGLPLVSLAVTVKESESPWMAVDKQAAVLLFPLSWFTVTSVLFPLVMIVYIVILEDRIIPIKDEEDQKFYHTLSTHST